MPYNYRRAQSLADRLLRKFGREGRLRRGDDDRAIIVALTNYSAREREGSLIQLTDVRAYVSARGLTVPPDNEEDVLVVGAGRKFEAPFETFRLVAPPQKIDPAGTVVVWELQVRRA